MDLETKKAIARSFIYSLIAGERYEVLLDQLESKNPWITDAEYEEITKLVMNATVEVTWDD